MTLIDEIEKGIAGRNLGLNIGLPKLNSVLSGLQKKTSFAIGAEKKVGKTAYSDIIFVLNPYLLNPKANIHWKYFSFEIDRINKEAKYAAFFMAHDYGITTVKWPNGEIKDLCDNYILGKSQMPDGTRIVVTPEHKEKLYEVYKNRIIPLFGEYNLSGSKIKQGKIDFIEDRLNPTGIRNYLINYAKENGQLLHEDYTTEEEGKKVKKQRLIGYKENDSSLFTMVILDHVRNMSRERGFSMKENIDKFSEYHVWLRNMFMFSFAIISHINRGTTDIERMKFMRDRIYPTSEDFKDSGNLPEDVSHVLTIFNPCDDKYNLSSHFDEDLDKYKPTNNYRTVHLVDSRFAPCPLHLGTTFKGGNLQIKEI